MKSALAARLQKLEATRAPRLSLAVLPYDAADHGPAHLAEAIERTQRAHVARHGHRATTMIRTGVPRSAEWTA